jgi:hypothetical protein
MVKIDIFIGADQCRLIGAEHWGLITKKVKKTFSTKVAIQSFAQSSDKIMKKLSADTIS